MNLYYNPSLTELQDLISSAIPSLPDHYIVVDYDGEVIIDPDLRYPDVNITRYKFCTQIKNNFVTDTRLHVLHESLVHGFEGYNDQSETEMRIAA